MKFSIYIYIYIHTFAFKREKKLIKNMTTKYLINKKKAEVIFSNLFHAFADKEIKKKGI